MENKLIVQRAIDFVMSIYNLEKQVMADGKVNMLDIGPLMAMLPTLSDPNSKGIFKNLPAAIGALTQQELVDVLSYAATKLSVKDVRTQKIASEAVQTLLHAYRLSQAFGEPKV